MPAGNPRIAIIGAGMCGLTAAISLAPHADVTVFEKSRGLGGRMSTRRHDQFMFDHGASFFTVDSPEFAEFIEQRTDVVSEWLPAMQAGALERAERTYVCSPTMNALVKQMANGVKVVTQTEVAARQQRHNQLWSLSDTHNNHLGQFDWLVCTAPPLQTLQLLGDYLPTPSKLRRVNMRPVHSLMLGLSTDWAERWDIQLPFSSLIDRVVIDSEKPGRTGCGTSVTVQTISTWSELRLDYEPASLADAIWKNLSNVVGLTLDDVVHRSVHRWRYALVDRMTVAPMQFDDELRVVAGGDWSEGNSVEDAWKAGRAIAAAILDAL